MSSPITTAEYDDNNGREPDLEAFEEQRPRGGLLGKLQDELDEYKRLTTTADGLAELLGLKRKEIW